ncbi:hypothetical protein HB662_21175 [Roseomonas frigidaquae]|uniref:Uncharacterized protein n=1 Tax=Falsiroseomonas frigidaquae TaxID=487318 RepID=A0ABX1F4Q0_9PROT|nr:hypothetical protein [Falsiroseomonas frigidaquae]NKE47303.1 hypothetical protein [Falsiroseomonas frigidaquae]
MPAVYEHIHFRKQKKMAGRYRAALTQAIAELAVAAPTTDQVKLSRNLRNAVYTACQMHDQAQLVQEVYFKTVPGSARCAGDADWCIFYAMDIHNPASNVQLLMLGRIAGVRLEAFFDFRISEEDAIAFDGASVPATDNTVDMNYRDTVLSNHGNKHFGVDRGANQYDIGASAEVRYRIVRGMEEKAAAHGVMLGSEAYFMFDRRVGYEGTKGNAGAACVCIRVDTPGLPTQHSHPIPTTGVGSHDAKLKDAIRQLTVKGEVGLPYLVQMAKYLTIIGARRLMFTNLRADKALYGVHRPPECVYWAW